MSQSAIYFPDQKCTFTPITTNYNVLVSGLLRSSEGVQGVQACQKCQRCKNVPTCKQCWCEKILSHVKSLQNFTLFCQEIEQCRDFPVFVGLSWHIVEFNVTYWHFSLTILVFWVFYAVCQEWIFHRSLRTFLVK